MEAVSKLFARGLLEIEIAVIKRMRSLGLPRDYIFGFIAQPGRVITPAAIGEVMSGKIGPEVEPATIATTRLFVSSRIASVRLPSSEEQDSPISPWRVEQALIWAQRGQDSLLPSEGYNTEFKLLFQPESEIQYIKTLLAFVNSGGGYLFFGLSDVGKPVSFCSNSFSEFDWDSFDQKLNSCGSLPVKWDRRLIDVPTTPEHRFDARFIKHLAEERGIPKEKHEWITKGVERANTIVGVIYAYPSNSPVLCKVSKPKKLKEGVFYYRSSGRNSFTDDVAKLPKHGFSSGPSAREQDLQKRVLQLEADLRFRRGMLNSDSCPEDVELRQAGFWDEDG